MVIMAERLDFALMLKRKLKLKIFFPVFGWWETWILRLAHLCFVVFVDVCALDSYRAD